jgi:dolichol-phosphate mannosyltransferase
MISIITPTYNESKNISRLIKEIAKAMKGIDYTLIVSDDDSPDGTANVARGLAEKYPVRVLVRNENKGLSQAVWDGFKIAEGDIVGVIDADLSHPPEIIPDMIKAMRERNADMVVASRLVKGGGTEGWPAKRKFNSYWASLLCKPLTTVQDPLSGFFFLKRKVFEGVIVKTKGYKILLELLVKGNYEKVIEYPFVFRNRTAGESKLNIKTQLQYIAQLNNLYLYSIRHPGRFRGRAGSSKYFL